MVEPRVLPPTSSPFHVKTHRSATNHYRTLQSTTPSCRTKHTSTLLAAQTKKQTNTTTQTKQKTNHKTKTHNKTPKTREQDSLPNAWTLERRARHARRKETGEAFSRWVANATTYEGRRVRREKETRRWENKLSAVSATEQPSLRVASKDVTWVQHEPQMAWRTLHSPTSALSRMLHVSTSGT